MNIEINTPIELEDSLAKVRIAGDITVCVPDDITLITPYVLLEQEDWFEDEIKFVRQMLQPGMQVIDIGANYGVYTLTAANIIGYDGKVWAFEPSLKASTYLLKSISENKFDNVNLLQVGLSDSSRKGLLKIERNEELNSILVGQPTDGNIQEIQLLTLGECADKYGWHDIAFIKLDAEGHESNIIEGGKAFLTQHSPLIMFEIKAGDELNLDLVKQFESLDYSSYRLIPGLKLLVPFDTRNEVDSYQLNLFCCKEDRAASLSDRGLLVSEPVLKKMHSMSQDAWIAYLKRWPYSNQLWESWKRYNTAAMTADWEQHREALNCYASAHSSAFLPPDRYAHLQYAYRLLYKLVETSPNLSRFLSFIRVASELGQRRYAVAALKYLVNYINSNSSVNLSEPFLLTSARYETIDPHDNIGNWVVASILEQFDRLCVFSTYYSGVKSLDVLEKLRELDFQSPETERRRQLVRMQAGMQRATEYSEILSKQSNDNLNVDVWSNATPLA